MNRKWFGIALILLGIILIAFFIYLFFIKPIRNGNGPIGSLPELPFGLGGGGKQFTDDEIGTGEGVESENPLLDPFTQRQLLFQITDFPITGYTTGTYQKEKFDTVTRLIDVENPDGSITTEEYQEEILTLVDLPKVRYHDKEGGLIYDTIIDNGLEEKTLISSPITSMYESIFAGENRLFLRYFDTDTQTIKTYRGTLSSSLSAASCPYDFTQPYQLGDTARDIERIQTYIQYVSTPIEPLTPGVFDEAMKKTVEAFQKARGIKVDGIIKNQTNKEIQEVCLESEQRALEKKIRTSTTAPYAFSGIFIDDNIHQLAVRPDQSEIFRLIDKKNSAWGIVSDASGKNENRVYDFNFRDWIIHWVAPEIISFTTKASGRASGSWYLYDLERGDLFNVLKDVKGLTTLASPVGDKALYTYSPNERTIQFGIVEVKGRILRPLPLQTFPEKCAWSEDNIHVYCMVPENIKNDIYPDRWYQGEVVFDDVLWKINTQTSAIEIVETFSKITYDIDGVTLRLNQDESFIFFIDQRTGYHWARDLEKQ